MATLGRTAATGGPVAQVWVAAAAGAGLALLAVAAARAAPPGEGLRLAAAVPIGALAGLCLYHASFGFTSAWRRLMREGRGAGLRAQCLLIGLTALVSYPLIGLGPGAGLEVHPVVLPMGIASALGALAFGLGMQLGGGCGSGTLYTAAGGSLRMLVVLAAFVAGSVWATRDIPVLWDGLPAFAGVSAVWSLGWGGALAGLGGLLGLVWILTGRIERRRHGALEPWHPTGSWVRGPWSMAAGAVGLAFVGIACFLVFGRPWGITDAFALWGAGLLEAAGVPVAGWPYWQGWRADQLAGGPFADRTSVMDLGLMLGAMTAAALAGRWRPGARLGARDLWTAVVGGLLMGYGARLSGGCNIGAYLGGLVSGSLHGLWWVAFAFAGSAAGVWVRARIGMDPPLAQPRAASAAAT